MDRNRVIIGTPRRAVAHGLHLANELSSIGNMTPTSVTSAIGRKWDPSLNKKYEPAPHPHDNVGSPVLWEPSLALLKYAIAANLIGAVIFSIVARIATPDQPARFVGPTLLALVAVTAWYLLSRGRMHASVNVLAIGAWMVITGASAFNGGVRAPIIVAYPLMILMFGWLISRRAALAVAALTVAAIIGLVMSESWGLLPYAPPSPPALHGVVQVSLIVLATLIIIFLVRIYQNRLKELVQIRSDLTADRLAEAQRLENEKFQAGILNSVPLQIAVLDRLGVIVAVNQAWKNFALENSDQPGQAARNTHIGVNYLDICRSSHGNFQEGAGEVFDGILKVTEGTMPSFSIEYPCPSPTEERWFAMTVTPLTAQGQGVVVTHNNITERRQLEASQLASAAALAVAESRQRLRELAAQNEARREGERKHVAREVHDELGQVLTALRMDLSLLGMKSGSQDPTLMEKVQGMKSLVDRAIQGVRNVAVNLRPTALDMGLISAIEWLCSDFTERTAIPCVLLAQEENIDLDETRAVVIFRIVQESLTNISRYAQASQVDINLGRRGNELRMEVRDDGQGFDLAAAASKKSFGLLGMRERALALGGRVDIASAPGQGTVISLTIPIDLATAKDNS